MLAKLYNLVSVVAMVVIIIVGVVFLVNQLKTETSSRLNFGGVTVGNEYIATTTPYYGDWTDQLIKTGSGSIGSVVITKSGNVEFYLLDATSTQAIATQGFNTTTKTLAAFPEDTAVGTYTFDATFFDGLVLEVVRGSTGSSTILFR
jgi:ABC-type cobalt transport system substrate-binding protein